MLFLLNNTLNSNHLVHIMKQRSVRKRTCKKIKDLMAKLREKCNEIKKKLMNKFMHNIEN